MNRPFNLPAPGTGWVKCKILPRNSYSHYANGKRVSHGTCIGTPHHILSPQPTEGNTLRVKSPEGKVRWYWFSRGQWFLYTLK